MSKRINFFATKNDRVSVLSEMEEQLPFEIKYIQCGKNDSISYSTVKDIPGLGTLREKHNEISDGLYKAVRKILNAEFRKVRGWYIGKEAGRLYGKLRFICIGLSEPELYDFRITEL